MLDENVWSALTILFLQACHNIRNYTGRIRLPGYTRLGYYGHTHAVTYDGPDEINSKVRNRALCNPSIALCTQHCTLRSSCFLF